MKYILELEIDPYNEHLALEAELSVENYNRPLMYWENNSLRELPVKSARLKLIKEGD